MIRDFRRSVARLGFACALGLPTLVGLLGVATGCTTPYQPAGFRGGYSDFQIETGLYYVAFEGNGYTARGTVVKYWYERAAELCGNEGFELLSDNDISREQLIATAHWGKSGGRANVTNLRKEGMEGYIRCKR